MRRSISLERPYLHLTETLPTKLRLSAQRLLRHQRVRPGGTRMHLVFHKVMQL